MSKKFTLFFIIFMLLQTNFFFLVEIKPIYELICLLLIAFVTFFEMKKNKRGKYIYKRNVYFFIFFLILEIIYSYFKYEQDIIYILYASAYNFIILSYFIFSNHIKTKHDLKKIQNIFILFSFVLTLLYIVQFLLYNKGIIFLNVPIRARFGEARIHYLTILPNLGFLLSIIGFMNRENKTSWRFFYLINSVLTLVYIVFIAKVRMAILVIFICSLVFFLVKYRRIWFVSIYLILFVGLLSFTYIYYFRPQIVINYMNSSETEEWSAITRSNEINYFLGQAKDNPIFGVGFIHPIEGTEEYYILRGEFGKFYANDVGIVGLMQTFGITGLVWYVLLLFKLLRVLKVIIKTKHIDDSIDYLVILTYIITTTPTLIITDKLRNFMLPVILGTSDYHYNNAINKKTNKT